MTESHARTVESLKAATGQEPKILEDRLRSTRIHVAANPATPDQWVQARIVVNLLHRMFPNLTIGGTPPAKLFEHYRVEKQVLQSVRPLTVSPKPPDDALVVAVGAQSLIRKGWTLYLDNRGWTALLSTTGPSRRKSAPHPNAIGAYYAGTLAVGQVFNKVFYDLLPPGRTDLLNGDFAHDLVTGATNQKPNHEPHVASLNLEATAIVGLGSIGQALVDILSGAPDLQGDIALIDFEGTDAGNESRYVLSFPSNRSRPKVGIAANQLLTKFPLLHLTVNSPLATGIVVQTQVRVQGRGVVFDAEQGFNNTTEIHHPLLSYQAFRAGVRQTPFKYAVTCLDSAQARRDVQMGLHQFVLNGWTDTAAGRMGYACSVHRIDGDNACLACLYHPEPAGELTGLDFALRVLGISKEKAQQDPDIATRTFGEQALQELTKNRGQPLTPDQVQQLTGKTLQEIIHDPECGLARLPGLDREPAAQVLHLPALAACHLAAQLVLLVKEARHTVANVAVQDGLGLPNEYSVGTVRPKEKGCLCTSPAVLAEYQQMWNRTQ